MSSLLPARALVLALLAAVQAAPPPDTEIFLAPLSTGAGAPVGTPVNVTNSPGYDNQPSFTPDGAAILFTSIRGGGTQTDIYRYDVASAATTRVTNTPESEYSPTVTPDGAHISVIRVEADGTQRLWRFTIDGRAPELVLTDVKPVGYHAWADDRTLALFVLGSPATLQIADTRTGEGRDRRPRDQPIDSADSRRRHDQLRRAERRRRERHAVDSGDRSENRSASRRSSTPWPARARPTARGRRTACW